MEDNAEITAEEEAIEGAVGVVKVGVEAEAAGEPEGNNRYSSAHPADTRERGLSRIYPLQPS